MQQGEFLTYEDFLSDKYTNWHFPSCGSTFCDIWLVRRSEPSHLQDHTSAPSKAPLMCFTCSLEEPWKKVKILKKSAGDVSLEKL